MRSVLLLVLVTCMSAGAYVAYTVHRPIPDMAEVLTAAFESRETSARPLTPEEALESFILEDAYRLETVAAEPLVVDPVSIRFDERGRMWVVEMRGYMPNVDGTGETEPVGVIAVLEDDDGDGRMDRRTEFMSGLVLPRGVLPLGGGEALILAPPDILHAADSDGDGVADETKALPVTFVDGIVNPEYAANSPVFGLDNWIYFARFPQRLRYRGGEWTVEPSALGGQWGLAHDDRGVWYFNTNEDHLRAHLGPPHYDVRRSRIVAPRFVDQSVAADQELWPARATPGVNRGYRPDVLRDDGRLRKFTSASGAVVYRGDLVPEFRGDVFVAEPAANLVRRDRVSARGAGFLAENAYSQREFLSSTDERFRPVDLQIGPDGALYVVDMYRGLIQHRVRLTGYLRGYVESRGLAEPLNRGRIWRVVRVDHEETPRAPVIPAQAAELVPLLGHANGWVRDTAQQMLVRDPSRARREVVALRNLAAGEQAGVDAGLAGVARVHALWTLEGIGALERDLVIRALTSDDALVREHAARLAEAWVAVAVDAVVLAALERAAAGEIHPRVMMQIAFTLGAVGDGDRRARDRAESALVEVLTRAGDDAVVRDAVLSGVARSDVEFLQRLSRDDRWQNPSPAREQTFFRLSACVIGAADAERAARLFDIAAADPRLWRRRAVLEGALAALPPPGARKFRFSAMPASLARLRRDDAAAIAALADRIRDAVEIGAVADARALSPFDQTRFESGAILYTRHCASCHRSDGRGTGDTVPPLAGSQWVLRSPRRLVRILLHGMTGPVEVGGRVFSLSSMPEFASLGDEQIAAVATYVRREWQHVAEPVDIDLVRAVRSENPDRDEPWTEEELVATP